MIVYYKICLCPELQNRLIMVVQRINAFKNELLDFVWT